MKAAATLSRKGSAGGKTRRDTTVNLRMPKRVRDLIDAAANVLGKTRTEFVVESAREHAVDVLLDQRFFHLTARQFAAFTAVLDNPPEPNEKLKQLMNRKAPWET
jgi:uncharacterized protein (DUF1778 family)